MPVSVSMGALSAGIVFLAMKQSGSAVNSRQASILGLTTAFLFSAQMINFPIIAGSSGHLLGGGLAGILLGNPWSATICMTTVLIIQSLFFADGGITALGANIFNVAILSVWIAWLLTRSLHSLMGGKKIFLPIAGALGAGISVIGTAISCGIQLAVSGTSRFEIVIPALVGIHLFIGFGEGVITWSILTYLVKVRPDLLPDEEKIRGLFVPIVSILILSGVLSLFTSVYPDGLETVAIDLGFIDSAGSQENRIYSPFSNYEIQGLGKIGRSITGLFGAILCFFMAFSISKVAKKIEK